jgi:hypothetical protein
MTESVAIWDAGRRRHADADGAAGRGIPPPDFVLLGQVFGGGHRTPRRLPPIAALDVLPEEPPTDSRLLGHPRLWLSPHAAYLSRASGHEYVMTQAENATSWLSAGRLLHPVDVRE